MGKPLIKIKVQLEKYPGKGGWTYARLPAVPKEIKNRWGEFRVKGFIDDYEVKQHVLFSMKEGGSFLPVRAEIRKKIKKEEGDWVDILFYADDSAVHVPEEFLLCLEDEPGALDKFNALSDSEKRKYLDHIAAAKTEEKRVERMAEAINKLTN